MKRLQGFGWGLALLLSANLASAQTPKLGFEEQPVQPVSTAPSSAAVLSLTLPMTAAAGGHDACCAGGCRPDCHVTWLKPWKCEDLEMKPAEHKARCHSCGLLHSLLYCPKDDDKGNGNGNGKDEKKEEKKNGKDEKKNGNGKEEEKAEEAPERTPLMQAIECRHPALFQQLDCRGIKIYGWIAGGMTFNTDSPRDRLNFGTNFNNRSNDVMLNQAYIVLEKPLDLDKKKDEIHFGFRADIVYGHDVPYFSNFAYGWSNHQTGASGQSPRTSDYALDALQFYGEMHLPVLTERGVDVRVGRFYTLLSNELTPAPQTLFYSHNYEYFYGPFTHTGVMSTVHIGDTLDVHNCFVRGWEPVFADNNDVWGYMGGLVWNSCDKQHNVTVGWHLSPEQNNNNDNWRRVGSGYYTRTFGSHNQWKYTGGGTIGWEQGGSAFDQGRPAEWYAINQYLFYTIDPRLTLGVRGEWFHDDDGNRTSLFNDQFLDGNRPGYAGSFYGLTLGATWKPYQNLRVRPEVRFDWFDGPSTNGSLPFNDQRDRFQLTFGFDVVWEF